jgi:peptidoglycan/xylan/chitin deacetylase (PgdA/CDA1 family)
MSRGKQALLAAYYHATTPYRAWWNRRAAAARRAPVMILFYHRVADGKPNDWTCPRDVFARQMRWIKNRFDVVSLAEAQRRLREGNPRPSVTVTFDDGYGDNVDFALPLLVELGIPCAYFVSTHFIRHGVPFPHDVKLGAPARPNTLDELRHWSARGIEIGAHTRTHADIGKIADRTRLVDEIVTAGEELQQSLGGPVRYFAFPYGMPANLRPEAFEIAYEAGYDGVCSAYGGYNLPGDDPFHLQRIHADPELLRLKNWLTVDPRKLGAPRYRYAAAAASVAEAQPTA